MVTITGLVIVLVLVVRKISEALRAHRGPLLVLMDRRGKARGARRLRGHADAAGEEVERGDSPRPRARRRRGHARLHALAGRLRRRGRAPGAGALGALDGGLFAARQVRAVAIVCSLAADACRDAENRLLASCVDFARGRSARSSARCRSYPRCWTPWRSSHETPRGIYPGCPRAHDPGPRRRA